MFIHNNISESNFQKENEDLKLEIQKYIPMKNSDQSPNLADEGDKDLFKLVKLDPSILDIG